MWRKICLISGVLGGHLALLGWLQRAPDPGAVAAPPLRFQLAPTALRSQSTAPALAPTPSPPPLGPVASKVKESRLFAVLTPAPTVNPMATETAVSTPAINLATTPGGTDETGATKPQAAAVTRPLTALAAPAQGGTMVLPSRDADYLNNPAPAYPAISRRLGEQGKVVIRVLIDREGKPQQGDIGQSSGYTRLDQAALRAVMSWRYVPGRRDGLVQDMWFDVPIKFALE